MELQSVPASLAWAHPVVQEWFVRRFGTPTEPQEQGWPHILDGKPVLISAPTGSGKTLAAFLICIDQLIRKALKGRNGTKCTLPRAGVWKRFRMHGSACSFIGDYTPFPAEYGIERKWKRWAAPM